MLENMVNEVAEEVVENGVNEVVETATESVADEVVETAASKKCISTKTKIIAGCVAGGVIAGLTVGTILYKKSKKTKDAYDKIVDSLTKVDKIYEDIVAKYSKENLSEDMVKAGELIKEAHKVAASKKSTAKKEKLIRDLLTSICEYIDDFNGIDGDEDEE